MLSSCVRLSLEHHHLPVQSLKADAFRMNKLMLSTLPESESAGSIFRAIDCEEGRVLEDNEEYDDSHDLRTFKKGTNFPRTVTCIVGAKVMFLTNSMINQGISNGTCGVIISLRPNGEPNVAFPTRDGSKVIDPNVKERLIRTRQLRL